MDPPRAVGETWLLLGGTTLQARTVKRVSESRGVGPKAAAEPTTTASGTVVENAACWEKGATGVAAAVESPRQGAQAAAAPSCFRVTNITNQE